MEDSILKSIKKVVGIAPEYPAFDEDIIMHINTAFSTLTQLGVGPVDGFIIEDDNAKWTEYIPELLTDKKKFNSVKTYIGLKVRQLFDPPQTSYLIAAMEKQIVELEFRLNVSREETEWADPSPPVEEVIP